MALSPLWCFTLFNLCANLFHLLQRRCLDNNNIWHIFLTSLHMLLWASQLKRLIKEFSGYKSRIPEVDLLMRKNKTSLTAHHFMSAPSDSLSHSLPIYLFVSQGHHQNASLRLLRPVFFSPPWPVTDSSVQSINLSQPQSGLVLFRAMHGQNAHTQEPTSLSLSR